MITPPTYGMYKVCANVNDVEIQSVPLTPDFDLRIPEVSICIYLKIAMFCNSVLYVLTCIYTSFTH